jgi:hypothetical protein
MWKLVKLFLLEEIRLRRSFSSSLSLIIFPEVILMAAMAGYIFLPLMEDTFTYDQIHTAVIGSLFMFGVSMGGIAFLGKDFIERSLGPVTMLAASTTYQPVGEKRMYFAFFLHDLVFYLFLILIPMTSGLLLGLIIRPMPLDRLLIITSAQWSTFLMGLSLSMLVSSALNNRQRRMLVFIPFSILPLVTLQVITGEVRAFVPGMLAVELDSWGFLVFSIFMITMYVVFGTLVFDGSERSSKKTAPGSYSRFMGLSKVLYPRDKISRSLFTRELLGMIRGKAYIRIGFSLIFPLIVMSGMIGLLSGMEDVPVSFNLTFFAVMVSFFTISIYTHLSNIDFLEFDQSVPINTPQLIRVKLRIYLVLSLPISLLFLITMALVTGDLLGLIFGIPLVLIAVPYMGYVTAYLTGLWTNSLIFDSSVFLRYMIFTVLPLMFSTMMSFMMVEMLIPSLVGIAVIIILGAISIIIISNGLDRKWKDTVLSSSGVGFRD